MVSGQDPNSGVRRESEDEWFQNRAKDVRVHATGHCKIET